MVGDCVVRIQGLVPNGSVRKTIFVDMSKVMLPTFTICGEIFMIKQLYKCSA